MNRLLRISLVIVSAGVLVALGGAGLTALAAGVLPQAAPEAAAEGFSMNNLWTLTEQAGPLRWPIFFVFIVGMFLVSLKWFELMSDRRESRSLEHIDFRLMGLPQIIKTISGQKDSMLARLHATMLNVFQSQQSQADLHDEIANYIRYQQDRFDTFKRRVDFMSDTAGALGLLGTVWGIFTVFSQGLLDDQVILIGMGFALITTLMGLIVSIILNLSSTEVFGFFNRRLERIGGKSDELRFRLMELAVSQQKGGGDTHLDLDTMLTETLAPVVSVSGSPVVKTEPMRPVPEGKPIAHVEAVLQDRFSNSLYGDSGTSALRKSIHSATVDVSRAPHALRVMNAPREEAAGRTVKQVVLQLVDEADGPVAGRKVLVAVDKGESSLNGGEPEVSATTDERGEVRFDWNLPQRAGLQTFTASVPGADAPGLSIKHTVMARPGLPRKLKQFGNNQGGPAGEKLPKPLKVQVLDEFENPISDWPVVYVVELGDGSFDNGKQEIKAKTDKRGEIGISFRVGTEPGFNTVKVTVDGVGRDLKFQAMSMS